MSSETSIWIHSFSCDTQSVEVELAPLMSQHQLQLQRLISDHPQGPGLLCFTTLTPELYAYLERISGNGQEPVLAIALLGQSINDEQYWHLLKSGAADVLCWQGDVSGLMDRIVALLSVCQEVVTARSCVDMLYQ